MTPKIIAKLSHNDSDMIIMASQVTGDWINIQQFVMLTTKKSPKICITSLLREGKNNHDYDHVVSKYDRPLGCRKWGLVGGWSNFKVVGKSHLNLMASKYCKMCTKKSTSLPFFKLSGCPDMCSISVHDWHHDFYILMFLYYKLITTWNRNFQLPLPAGYHS